jgi:hypothetical protein
MSVGTGMKQASCRGNVALLVFKLKWEGEQAAMGSSQVMKLRRPAQDFARHFYRLNVEATVFRNGNESDRFLALCEVCENEVSKARTPLFST